MMQPILSNGSTSEVIIHQPFDDPFGDGLYRAITSSDGAPTEHQINTSTFTANSSQSFDVPQPAPQKAAADVGVAFYDATDMPSGPFGMQPTTSSPFPPQESSSPNHDIDILTDILPPSGPPSFVNSHTGYPVAPDQSVSHSGFPPQTNQLAVQSLTGQSAHQNGFQTQTGQPSGFPTQLGQPSLQSNYPPQPADSFSHADFPSQTMGLALPQDGLQAPQVQSSSLVAAPKPSLDKFETKSIVWADTLSCGLINLNISGSKTNPLADIGVDFEYVAEAANGEEIWSWRSL